MNFAAHRPDDVSTTDDLQTLARDSLASCRTALLTARQSVLSARDPVAIHAVRVALRRLRAALALFKAALPPDIAVALRHDAKQFADACGPTRDLDVFLAGTLTEIDSRLADRADIAAELRSLRASALRLRRVRHDAVREALQSEVFAVFDVRLNDLTTGTWRDAPAVAVPASLPEPLDFARDTLRRRHRKLRRTLARLEELDAAQRHTLRLQVKRQRYVASFLAERFDRKAVSAYIRAATCLQDALGLANDRTVASRVVADIRAAARAAGQLDWIAGLVQGVLAAHADAHDADDRAVAAAAKRFVKAPRFWRRPRRRKDDGVRP